MERERFTKEKERLTHIEGTHRENHRFTQCDDCCDEIPGPDNLEECIYIGLWFKRVGVL